VIAFAGDALVCIFEMKESHIDDPRICCLDAIRCALELKDLRKDPLTVHLALSYGDMCLGRLGTVHQSINFFFFFFYCIS
jgi:class 3 adenylate cyclase